MSYSIISVLALILNLIINHEAFKNIQFRHEEQKNDQKVVRRYSGFLIASNCYFIADIAWGLLYEHHSTEGLFPFLYFDCVLYFLFMFLTMLTWMRYILSGQTRAQKQDPALCGMDDVHIGAGISGDQLFPSVYFFL